MRLSKVFVYHQEAQVVHKCISLEPSACSRNMTGVKRIFRRNLGFGTLEGHSGQQLSCSHHSSLNVSASTFSGVEDGIEHLVWE